MTWWQGVLIFFGTVLVGAVLGLIIVTVILAIQHKPLPHTWLSTRKPIVKTKATHQGITVAATPDKLAEFVAQRKNKLSKTPDVGQNKQARSARFDALVEVETNLAIANSPWTDKLLPFQTSVWDNSEGKVDFWPPEIQTELQETYTDMLLANTIVWLSTDVGRRSKELDESYQNLCQRIAERLKKMRALLVRSGT